MDIFFHICMLGQSVICIVQFCYTHNFVFYQLPKNELKSPSMIGNLSLTLYSFSLLLLVYLPLSISFSFFVSFSVYVFISLCGFDQLLSHVWLFVTVACQAPLSIFQARILQQIAISYSRESFQPRDWTRICCTFCISRWILYRCTTWEAISISIVR